MFGKILSNIFYIVREILIRDGEKRTKIVFFSPFRLIHNWIEKVSQFCYNKEKRDKFLAEFYRLHK